GPDFLADDPSAATVEVANDGALVLRGRDDLDVHHRLEEHGLGLPAALLETDGGRDLEGHLARVHVVVAPVRQRDLDVHHGIACEHARFSRFLDALLDRGHVLAWDGGALELVLEDHALARLRGGLDLEPHVAVLSAAARLAHEAPLRLRLLADRLAISDLGLADVGLDLELSQEPVDDDLEVQLAHAVDERLVRLGIHVDLEGRVFHGEAGQRLPELLLVGLGLGLDGHGDDGRAGLRLARLGIDALDGGDVEGRWQVIHHRVEHGLDALVLERGAADHREELHADGPGAHSRLDLLRSDLLAAEVFLHQVIVDL